MLVDSPSTEPLCACETFNRKRALVKTPGKQSEEVPVIGVASVFTPSKSRGKGYAGTMMRLLSERLKKETGSKGFSVLYSDVGPTFYDRNGGWKAHQATEVNIPATSTFSEEIVSMKLMTLEEAEECIKEDARLLKQEMDDLEISEVTAVQLIPQNDELEWATVRGRQSAQASPLKQSENVGARIVDEGKLGYITWVPDLSRRSLTVLRLREPTSDAALKRLVSAALREARDLGLEKVKIWCPSSRLLKLLDTKVVLRDENLPCLLPLGTEERIQWRNIEKLGWC